MRKNLSQQKLLEILTSEIETLKQTTENINEIAPEIDRQLQILKSSKLKYEVDTDKLEQLLKDHKRKLEKSVVIPRWFLWLIAAIMIWLIFQILFRFI
ncbi:SNARE domain-containing protein [uncultured Draconibacterium sp.]|uniref:SNARE domain-containing protein n=1 Tax=uncultured Draconibacterium sp. TaxID=1573823 RepID=UPI002619C703|nr:SNARE domain-containing protein [uncultured Draconibacterium sp.]